MPKRLDFTSKKLHHEYLCFKTFAKKVLEWYDRLEDSVKVIKVLMWMGPEACVKHELHPFPPGDKEKITLLWNFFDNLCSKKEGCQGSWNAARMTLKFMKHEKGESVDIFYRQIRDVLHQCEYDPAIQKVLEAETLKYGLTNAKIIEKVYALQKDVDASCVLDTARAEEQAQTHIREVEKIRRDHNLRETKSAEELRQQKKPFSKKSKASSDGRTKNQYDCKRCGHKHGPKQYPAYGKNAVNAKRRATLLSSAVLRQMPILPESDLASRNKYPDSKRSFTKQLQTQEVAKQASQSMTLTRSQCKLTL